MLIETQYGYTFIVCKCNKMHRELELTSFDPLDDTTLSSLDYAISSAVPNVIVDNVNNIHTKIRSIYYCNTLKQYLAISTHKTHHYKANNFINLIQKQNIVVPEYMYVKITTEELNHQRLYTIRELEIFNISLSLNVIGVGVDSFKFWDVIYEKINTANENYRLTIRSFPDFSNIKSINTFYGGGRLNCIGEDFYITFVETQHGFFNYGVISL